MDRYECVCFIVHHGSASRILRYARGHGISGGTVYYGTGTAKGFWKNFFEVSHSEKELLMMVTTRNRAFTLIDKISDMMHLEKPDHGIAFSMPVEAFTGGISEEISETSAEEANTMYKLITIIVKKGKAEDALEAAQSAGAGGGTIINARGAGRHETSSLFHIAIEPEKEILLILSEASKTDAILEAVHKKTDMDSPGNGVMFVQDISRVYGLHQQLDK